MWIQYKNNLVYVTRVFIWLGEPHNFTLVGVYGDDTYLIKKFQNYDEAHEVLSSLTPRAVNVV